MLARGGLELVFDGALFASANDLDLANFLLTHPIGSKEWVRMVR